jgi:ATP-dependent Clp protease ATP-binding subunit ClpA
MAEVQVDLYELPADQQELRGSLMNGYAFSENVRGALAQARAEAENVGHEYVGTEHILLAIVGRPDNIAASLLTERSVEPSVIRAAIFDVVQKFARTDRRDLPYASRAKKVLEFAMSEAQELDATSVNTGHLFLGVMREEKGLGAQVLHLHGFELDAVRTHLLRMMQAGRLEHAPSDAMTATATSIDMHPLRAATLLNAMLRSPRVASVFTKHNVDVPAVVRDLLAEQQRS